jgi:hypothetical protein
MENLSNNPSQNSNTLFLSSPRAARTGSSYRTARSRSLSKERKSRYQTSNGQRFREPRVDADRGRRNQILRSKHRSISSQMSAINSCSSSTSHNRKKPVPVNQKFVSPFPQNLRSPIPKPSGPKDMVFKQPCKRPQSKPDLVLFMNEIVEKLSAVRDNSQNFQDKDLAQAKESVYTQIETLIDNCEKVELGFDILVGHKLAKYMHLAYSLLLSINDSHSIKYKSLILKLNRLNKFCKSKVVSFVSDLIPLPKTQTSLNYCFLKLSRPKL